MAYFFKGIPFKGIKAKATSLKYNEIFAYSIPLVIASLWGVAIKSADQFYISRFFGNQVFAEYSNGFIELPFVGMITTSTSIVLMPVFSKVFHKNEGIEELLIIWRNTMNKSAIIIFPLVIFFISFASEIMIVLYTDQYKQSSIYFRINMFLNFFNIIIFVPVFLAMGKTKLYAKIHMLLAVVIWISSYFVIQIFKTPIAIACNTTMINIFKIMFFIYLTAGFLKVRIIDLFPVKSLLRLFLHGISIVVFVKIIQIYLISELILIIQLVICSILYGLLLLLSSKFFKVDYISMFKPLISNFIKK
jgi:O-antigen/teichoic acid export membrane protein